LSYGRRAKYASTSAVLLGDSDSSLVLRMLLLPAGS